MFYTYWNTYQVEEVNYASHKHIDTRPVGTKRLMMLTADHLTSNQAKDCSQFWIITINCLNTLSKSVQFSSVSQPCPTLCDPMDCSMPGFPVCHQLHELAQTHVHWVHWYHQLESCALIPSNHLILCCPLLLLPSIFPSIRDFRSESVHHTRWPNYWSFRISPTNKYSGLISFRIEWSPCSPRDSQESAPTPQFKNISSSVLSFPYGATLTSILDCRKNHSFD